jgi:AraC-like DNA-binding protein
VAEIEKLNEKNEQEVHEARIKFMTISDSDNEFLKKLEEVIENNFSNPDISVDFLASEMNVSRSGLFAKVKSLADITPNEMIQIIRLKHAARLIETKKYRINEICYMVGFNSPSYFSKCFMKHFGVKPAEYAK